MKNVSGLIVEFDGYNNKPLIKISDLFGNTIRCCTNIETNKISFSNNDGPITTTKEKNLLRRLMTNKFVENSLKKSAEDGLPLKIYLSKANKRFRLTFLAILNEMDGPIDRCFNLYINDGKTETEKKKRKRVCNNMRKAKTKRFGKLKKVRIEDVWDEYIKKGKDTEEKNERRRYCCDMRSVKEYR